ncbi:MAG: hypothetical protein LBS69_09935 [Prevotellaceae bacterium]|jgi:hypothetical protein|nr:hypothetical protein [Prevotellaceae bacterium]
MKKTIFLLLTSCLLASCAKEDVLDRTIFIPDESDPNLPAYTEWGYNSFGAKYERSYFLASNSIIPCKILYKDGKLQFSLIGNIDYEKITLSFIFPFPSISDYSGLIQLNDKEINLVDADCTVKISQNDGNDKILNVLNGKLHFKRTQLLNIDDIPNRVILSGTFELRFMQDDFPESISDGRFDLGINNNTFYAF